MSESLLRSAPRRVVAALGDLLPHGKTLPEASWRVRHRAVVILLLAHAVVLVAWSVAATTSVSSTLINAAVPALGAYAATRASLPRVVRSGIASVAVMLTSAVVVHLMSGSIEGHFHFFAMIPVVALYEDWIAFGLAVSVVLMHHGVMGTVDPQSVYNHHGAWDHPWRYAFIHAAFFGSACIGAIINWRLHEKARDAEALLTARMRHQAHHDALTGLPNRTQLLDRAHALLGTGDGTTSVAVLLIDLDRFKEINDVLGHASGDVLLAHIGPRMATAVRDGDLLARLGGDEFAAVLPHADEKTAIAVAKRLLDLLTETVDVGGVTLQVDGSIGIAVANLGSDHTIDSLLRQADIAMYTAKRARCGYTVFHEDQDTSTRERLTLLGELRQAITRGEIVLHYQPKLTLADGKLVGVEALARWQHPERGLLSPAEFIPIAESTGLIVPLTLHVLDLALAQMRRWRSAGHDFGVAVNLSPRCLAEPELTEQVTQMLWRYHVPATSLELEITENTLAHDPERALATLTALDQAGIRISIDDFGTGYSSMSYLKRLPVSELKVDRSFVAGMLACADDEVLVRSLVELGHNLGLTVVAEGVEDDATLHALGEVGCDVAQGYFLARPMPAEALRTWLGAHIARGVPAARIGEPDIDALTDLSS
jgi:diguanylate cyclase (GGDEF)-like protein